MSGMETRYIRCSSCGVTFYAGPAGVTHEPPHNCAARDSLPVALHSVVRADAAGYGLCATCHAPRGYWRATGGGVDEFGLSCSADPSHGPDVPPS